MIKNVTTQESEKQVKTKKLIGGKTKKFTRDKEQANVGTIGHIDHGKSTLTYAIALVLNKKGYENSIKTFRDVARSQIEVDKMMTIESSVIEYVSAKRHYSHVDMPGHREFVKNMISGASQVDFVILVVSLKDGIEPQTQEHVLLISQLGIKNIVVFLNKADMIDQNPDNFNDEVEGLKEMVKLLLEQYKIDTTNVQFVVGSAKLAVEGDPKYEEKIWELVQILDNMPLPQRDKTAPFLLPIDNIFSKKGVGTIVTGRIDRGTINIDDKVEIIGLNLPKIDTSIRSVETFHKDMDECLAGDNVGILLRNVEKSSIKRGQFLVAPGSIPCIKKFKANIHALSKDDGGRADSFGSSGRFSPQFFIKTANITGTIKLDEGIEAILPGDTASVEVELFKSIPLQKGWTFSVRESGKTIALGQVQDIIN